MFWSTAILQSVDGPAESWVNIINTKTGEEQLDWWALDIWENLWETVVF